MAMPRGAVPVPVVRIRVVEEEEPAAREDVVPGERSIGALLILWAGGAPPTNASAARRGPPPQEDERRRAAAAAVRRLAVAVAVLPRAERGRRRLRLGGRLPSLAAAGMVLELVYLPLIVVGVLYTVSMRQEGGFLLMSWSGCVGAVVSHQL